MRMREGVRIGWHVVGWGHATQNILSFYLNGATNMVCDLVLYRLGGN